MLKTSMIGLGSIAALFVVWRVLTMVFVLGIVAFKIVVFFVLPLAFAIWFVRKVLRSERRDAPVA